MVAKNTKSQRLDEISRDLANEFIKSLKEDGELPWSKGYDSAMFSPHNPASGTIYSGTSSFILYLQNLRKNYHDPRWMTYNQAKELGGNVKRGEKATWCIHWQPCNVDQKDKDGTPLLDEDGQPITKKILIPCPYAVFNVKQIQGLNLPPLVKADHQWDPNERVEKLVENSGAKVYNEPHINAPHYRPASDEIYMPLKGQFYQAGEYYATLLHEMSHWTGHPNRLNRFNTSSVHLGYKQEYAREELRAEISSSILSVSMGLNSSLNNHKAYVKDWIKILDSDPKEILKATAQADKIVAYLKQYDPVKEQEIKPLLKDNNEKVSPQKLPELKTKVTENINDRVDTLDLSIKNILEKLENTDDEKVFSPIKAEFSNEITDRIEALDHKFDELLKEQTDNSDRLKLIETYREQYQRPKNEVETKIFETLIDFTEQTLSRNDEIQIELKQASKDFDAARQDLQKSHEAREKEGSIIAVIEDKSVIKDKGFELGRIGYKYAVTKDGQHHFINTGSFGDFNKWHELNRQSSKEVIAVAVKYLGEENTKKLINQDTNKQPSMER